MSRLHSIEAKYPSLLPVVVKKERAATLEEEGSYAGVPIDLASPTVGVDYDPELHSPGAEEEALIAATRQAEEQLQAAQIVNEEEALIEATLAAEEEARASVEVAEAAAFDRVSLRGMPPDETFTSDSDSQEF